MLLRRRPAGRIESWVPQLQAVPQLNMPRRAHLAARRRPAAAAGPIAPCIDSYRRRTIATWPVTLPTTGTTGREQKGAGAAAGSREHSVRRVKVANAVDQQLRLVLQHPADLTSSGRPGSSSALVDIALQQVEVNGDLSVATVWWRLKDEEDAVASEDGVHTRSGEPLRRLSRADLDGERQAANRAIKSSTSWMRRRVGAALKLRKVPALRFRHADIATSEPTNGRRKSKRKTAQPKERRAQRLQEAFAAIADERTHDQDSTS